jgi:hypothetical protein
MTLLIRKFKAGDQVRVIRETSKYFKKVATFEKYFFSQKWGNERVEIRLRGFNPPEMHQTFYENDIEKL